MKHGSRWVALITALALTFAVSTTACGLEAEFGLVYGTDSLNLRAQGSSSSAWLGQYSRGSWVEITGSQNNFYRVRTPDGKTGYMSKNYIRIPDDNYLTVVTVNNAGGGAFLNFRAQPSYSAQVLGIFYTGVPLLVLSETNGWYMVRINDQIGYVRSEYVGLGAVQLASDTVATIKTPGNTPLNLRSGPGTQYGVIAQFPGDRYVMVLDQGAGWWRVSVDGYLGFMDSSFLQLGLHAAKDAAARQTADSYAVVKNPGASQALNLRQAPTTASPVLSKLYNGAVLDVTAHGSQWSAVTVRATGESGYVMTQYLELHNLSKVAAKRVTHPGGTFVNLRAAPDLTYGQVLKRVPSGASVTVKSPGSEWYKVSYSDYTGTYTGYMLSYFLQ